MKVGDKVNFKSVNGASHTGVIIKLRKDTLDRVWYSVKTEESTCPYLVGENEVSKS